MRGTLSSFEIRSDASANRSLLRNVVLSAVCDRLTALDAGGNPQPALAISWRSQPDARAWRFTLRDGVALHSGGTLTQQMVIASLAAMNPSWRIRPEGREVLIESDTPLASLPYQLAESRNSICLAGTNGQWVGSGPFQIADFQADQYIELQSFDDAWQGRPFLDRVRIQMGKPFAIQMSDLQTNRVDVAESDPAQRLATNLTDPVELIALAFTPNRPASSDVRLREAIARSIDRSSIYAVLLRRQGEPALALLPEWISGYAHLFGREQASSQTGQLRRPVPSAVGPLSLLYEANDDPARLIAERILLNGRDSGITLQPRAESPAFRSFDADVRLVRIRLESPAPAAALSALGDALEITSLQTAQAATDSVALFALERQALKDYSVIPIAVVPEAYTVSRLVHDWSVSRWGAVDLGGIWMQPEPEAEPAK